MPLTKRARRWVLVLSTLGVVGLLLAWWVDRQLEPTRLATTVLDRVGKAQGLRITFEGTPEYALRPEPRLLLRGMQVAAPGEPPFLTAQRAEVSLPWDTLTGGAPVITRIELDAPVFALPGFLRWFDARPPQPFRLPTLTHGIHVQGGRVLGEGFEARVLLLDLPRLQAGEPADLDLNGRYEAGETQFDVVAKLHLDTAGTASAYRTTLSGAFDRHPDKPLPFRLDSRGHLAWVAPLLSVDADALAFGASPTLPRIEGTAYLRRANRLAFGFRGIVREWLAVWPKLPEPLASQTRDLPVQLSYAGARDGSGPLALRVHKPPTTLDATLRVPELREWMAADPAAPLPPIAGTLRTPVIEVEGVRLEGVEATISR
jgi:hypothetical protein